MDWLKKLPVIGPLATRLMGTHAWRSYETLDAAQWSRLAAAMTFISFLALFPLVTVGAALAAMFLSESQVDKVEETLAEQVPGIAGELDISALVENAGTVSLLAGGALLLTGINWVGSMRGCLRAVWGKPEVDEDENAIRRKAADAAVLGGLGLTGLASFGASYFGSAAASWTARQAGVEDTWAGSGLLVTVAFALAVLADFLILLYVLSLLPGVHPPRRRLVVAALLGAVGFELLKLLIGGYMREVAARSMYGAFGVPVALLLWINFTAKLLLFCAAWTATKSVTHPEQDETAEDETAEEESAEGVSGGAAGGPGPAAASGG
ncbi:YihY/virulence factor BrkB family protein [Streptomyces triticagri]|uniref:YihY/virulence factor BrkB family protein n=1 Tax=Streptomyces triticagri TaxID=2293568 RepID=A0A372M962_9ACTN|nr:YihY/virulence factor BrkB family protein [Streptomyces triticagri]RFU87482.1 YihY/virulence factor BrkB family protein [Streptomyces triticagri]